MNRGSFSNMGTGAKNNIFISYRVHDTPGETGRLVDSLKQHFSDEQIFMDIEKIEPGVDFTDVINRSLESCLVMLVVIGNNWIANVNGKARINDPNDWVRIEVSTALQRNIRVIPVLVDDSKLPDSEELPADLQSLLRRQTIELSNKRWKYDTDKLIDVLKNAGIQPLNERREIYPPAKKPFWSTSGIWIIALIGVVAFIIILKSLLTDSSSTATTGNLNNPIRPVNNDTITNVEKPVTKANKVPVQTVEEKNVTTQNITGTWDESRNAFYLEVSQSGEDLSAKSYSMAGQQTGQGTGTIIGNEVKLSMSVVNAGIVDIEGTVIKNGKMIRGKTIINNNGASLSEPLIMIKAED